MKTHQKKNLFKPVLLGVLIVLAIMLASGTPATTLASPNAKPKTFHVSESFRNTTTNDPNWIYYGDGCLTATCDSLGNGNGWLLLNRNNNFRTGSAILNTAFDSTNGIVATFSYAMFGGSHGDGIAFYLIDGSTNPPTQGSFGGALGYSWQTVNGSTNGVTNGWVGIGFDRVGNFSNAGFGDCNPSCPGISPNNVVIRGSGNLGTGFNYLTKSFVGVETLGETDPKRVRITITPGATKYITVEMDSGSGFVTLINNYNMSTAIGQAAMPATFKLGFSAGTGTKSNRHEIRDLNVTGAQSSTTAVTCTPNPSNIGQSVTCTATVTGASGTPSGTIDFYDGATLLQAGVALNGSAQATYTTSAFAPGIHTINANYGGDQVYAASTNSTNHVVNLRQNSITSSLNPSTLGQNVSFTAIFNVCQAPDAPARKPRATGTISFFDGATLLATLPESVLDQCSVQAGFSSTTLAIGTHHISAVYSGDQSQVALNQVVNGPRDVPEGDTLLLLGGGMSGLGVWLRYQWSKRRAKR